VLLARLGRAILQIVDAAKLPADFQTSTIWVPTVAGKPVGPSERAVENASASLEPGPARHQLQVQPWTVSVAILSAENALYFLDACNRNTYAEDGATKIAPSTRFWAAALRFVAGLALRNRFIPSMAAEGERFYARWKPLIAAPDQERLGRLARAMPPVARAITHPDVRTAPEDDPVVLLSSFVDWHGTRWSSPPIPSCIGTSSS